jgi:hypothetical protein
MKPSIRFLARAGAILACAAPLQGCVVGAVAGATVSVAAIGAKVGAKVAGTAVGVTSDGVGAAGHAITGGR